MAGLRTFSRYGFQTLQILPGLFLFERIHIHLLKQTVLCRTHDLKLNIAALCSLLKLQSNEVPMSLQAIWPQTLARLSCLFKDLMEKQNGMLANHPLVYMFKLTRNVEISECEEEEEIEGNISEEETEGEEDDEEDNEEDEDEEENDNNEEEIDEHEAGKSI